MQKPIHKFNSANPVTICVRCRKIIAIGMTKDLYCSKKCEKKHTNGNKIKKDKL